MYLKRLYKTVVLKGFPLEKERKNQLELKSLKFHDKTQMSRIGGSWSICSSWSGYTFHCSCHHGLQGPRFSRTGPVTQKSLSRYDRTLEVDVVYSILELLILPWVKRQQLTKHCHQHCYWELEDPSFCPDPQCKLTTLHPKWTTSRASWLLNVHSPGPSNDLPSATPSAYRPGTWIFVHGDSYHLTTEEDTIPVDHCDPRSIQPSWCGLYLHSCPTLPRFSTALYSAVKSLQAK